MEEQPWIWNEFKLAGAARKFHSILDNGGSDDEDNDNNAVAISDRAAAASGPSRASIASAARPSSAIFATASNFRDNQQQQEEEEEESQQQKQQEQQQQRAGAMTADSPNVLDDYVYEDRPLMTKYALMADGEPAQYYGKLTSNLKRSQQPAPFNPPVTGKRRQKQQRNSMTLSSKSSTGEADAESSVASQQQQQSSLSSSSSLAAANIGRDSEPRVLPLLGFHSAVNKINRQKESLLKKILRQAGRVFF
jgi:hypothetical protein